MKTALNKVYKKNAIDLNYGLVFIETNNQIENIVQEIHFSKNFLGNKDILDFKIFDKIDDKIPFSLNVTSAFIPFKYEELMVDYKFETNNLHLINEYFGIEYMTQILNEKMKKSVKTLSTHIDLLCNFMCRNGKLSSINLFGIDKANVLSAASFEEMVSNFLNSSINKTQESKESTSSQVILMDDIRLGSTYFDCFYDNKFIF